MIVQMMAWDGDADALNVTLVERLLTPWAMVCLAARACNQRTCLSQAGCRICVIVLP